MTDNVSLITAKVQPQPQTQLPRKTRVVSGMVAHARQKDTGLE